MSSTTTPDPSSTNGSIFPSPTSTPQDNGSPSSNSLYLFTFLTTLLLLLAVSCGIVLRSFILRRRFRRRVEAAIAAGVLLPEQVDALRRRGPPIGEKPKIFEVHIDGRHKEGYEPSSTPVGLENVQDEWSNIMPVSAAIIPGAYRDPAPIPVPAPQQYSARPLNSRRPFWFLRAPDVTPTPILPLHSPSSTPSISRTPPQQNGGGQASPTSADDMLQLTVLIAMPNPPSRQHQSRHQSTSSEALEAAKGKKASGSGDGDEEEEDIPEVVFGVTEVKWEGGANWKPGENVSSEGKRTNHHEDSH